MPSLIILKGRVLIIRWRNWDKTVAFVKPPPPIHPTLNALSEGTLCWSTVVLQLNLVIPQVPSHLNQKQVSKSV